MSWSIRLQVSGSVDETIRHYNLQCHKLFLIINDHIAKNLRGTNFFFIMSHNFRELGVGLYCDKNDCCALMIHSINCYGL